MARTTPAHTAQEARGAGRPVGRARRRGDGLRTCLGCGDVLRPEAGLRLSATAEGALSVEAGQGGSRRGAYLCYRRACVEGLFRKRRLPRSLRSPGLSVGPELVLDLARSLLCRRVLYLLGKAGSSGRLVTGASGIAMAMAEGVGTLLVIACDTSPRTRSRMTTRATSSGIATYRIDLTREALGKLLKRDPCAGALVRRGPLADGLERELFRHKSLEERG